MGNHELYLRRRKEDSIEVQQMKTEERERREGLLRDRYIEYTIEYSSVTSQDDFFQNFWTSLPPLSKSTQENTNYGENVTKIEQKPVEIWAVECENFAIHFLLFLHGFMKVWTHAKITENVGINFFVYSATLKCVTTYNVFACFHVCITSNHYNVYIVARLLIGSKADIEVCTYIISGHTFERRAVTAHISANICSTFVKFSL